MAMNPMVESVNIHLKEIQENDDLENICLHERLMFMVNSKVYTLPESYGYWELYCPFSHNHGSGK